MDLCSVANISLLILDQPFHGFYVHGEAPSGRSDLVMADLKAKLDAEGEGTQRRRGLKNYNDLARQ
jgi:meckelin